MISKRVFPKTGEATSLLGFGCMRLPEVDGRVDEAAVAKLFDRALELGVNYFDTAYAYHNGQSESVVGRQLVQRHPRNSYFVATKMPYWLCQKTDDFDRLFSHQLERLQTTYLDYYLIHSIDESEWHRLKNLGINEFIAREQAAGRIRRIGFSSHDKPERIINIMDDRDWDFVQLQINYLDWKQQNAELAYNGAVERGLPVIVMEPVRGGGLATLATEAAAILKHAAPDKSLASWAIRWCGSLSQVQAVLSGMNELTQLEDNAAQFSPLEPITNAEQKTIDKALAAMADLPIINCTGCDYCTVCPESIAISDIFSAYNSLIQLNDPRGLTESYLKFTSPEHQADHCTKCETCLSYCPQHIDIPGELERVHKRALELSGGG